MSSCAKRATTNGVVTMPGHDPKWERVPSPMEKLSRSSRAWQGALSLH